MYHLSDTNKRYHQDDINSKKRIILVIQIKDITKVILILKMYHLSDTNKRYHQGDTNSKNVSLN